MVIMLSRTDQSYRLSLNRIRFDLSILSKIVKIGLPAGFQATMYTVSNVIIQASINSFGKDTASAWAAYGKIDVLFWVTMNSLGTVATTFAGQNYGAGKYDRVRNTTRQAFFIAAVITVPLSILLYNFGELLLMIFVKNPEVIAIGVQMTRFLVPFFIAYIGVEVFSGVLRGMGDALIPMLITLSGICILRVSWIFFVLPTHRSIETVEASYPITWITTSVLFLIYYLYFITKKKIKVKK